MNADIQTPIDSTPSEALTEEEGFVCMYPYIEPEFPGGTAAWQQFLVQNLRYPQEAMDMSIQGTVIVQFVVDADGSVSDVQAVYGPDELRQSAIDVIKQSPKWTPGKENGRSIKNYKKQPIVFRLEDEN
jgi:periplasmic protein TonB